MKVDIPRYRVITISSDILLDDSPVIQEVANALYARLHEIQTTIQTIDDQIDRLDKALKNIGIKYRDQDIAVLREALQTIETRIYSIGIGIEIEIDTDD